MAPDYLKTVVRNGSLGLEMVPTVGIPGGNRDLIRDQETKDKTKDSQLIHSVVRPTGVEPVTPRSVELKKGSETK